MNPLTDHVFSLIQAGDDSDRVQMLEDNDRPLAVQADWPNDSYCFRLCRRPDYQRSPNGKFNQYSGEMTVTITTPFPGTCSCMKLDFDDETTSQLMAERVCLSYVPVCVRVRVCMYVCMYFVFI